MATHLTKENDAVRAVAAACESALEASFATGLSVALVDATGDTRAATFGYADLAAKAPVLPSTLFEIGSISKSFTCALLQRAREAGLLDLDHPVRDYLPWFEVPSRYEPITLRHLATHTAGIIMGTEASGEAAFEVWSLRHTEATVEPGSYFHYSNVGYKTLGLVLEAVRGRPYHLVLADELLRPLGMAHSESAITHDTRRRLAVGYEPFYDDRPPRRADGIAPATWVESATADGSISSTAEDMAIWLRFIMCRGLSPSGERLLTVESIEEMLLPAVASDDDLHGSNYGLGLWTIAVEGHRYAGHTGGMVGYYAAVCCDLDEGLGAVVLGNGHGPWQQLSFHMLAAARAERSGGSVAAFEAPAEHPAKEPTAEEAPPEVAPFVGHYRCYNPWVPNMRVVWRHGGLIAEFPSGDVWAPELTLAPLGDNRFRVGEDPRSPERLAFDTVVSGEALRANYSGLALYRTFTP
jgi:CubicO group peptidase (beta-lactamase class C family)